MDANKFQEFFDPATVSKIPHHIVGCGAIGSNLALQLARCGCDTFVLYDEDIVSAHNIANQQFNHNDIGALKTECVERKIKAINPYANVTIKGKWEGQQLDGYIFLAVDSIAVRKRLVKLHKFVPTTIAIFDFRMRLKDAQHFAASHDTADSMDNLYASMNFTDEEAQANSPVSACNMTLSIIPTVITVCAVGVANYINYTKGQTLKQSVMVNPFDLVLFG